LKTNRYHDNRNSIIGLECVIVNRLDEAATGKVAGRRQTVFSRSRTWQ
jgi:hypothetical protein